MTESNSENNNADSLLFLKDKVFFVVGAENQLGLDISQIGAEMGAQVILAGMNESVLKEAAKRLVSQQHKAFFTCINPTKPDEVKSQFISLREKFKEINVLVLNLDFNVNKKIVDTNWVEWQNHLLINLTAPFLFIKYAMSYMNENSKIVVINTNKFNQNVVQSAAYCASKAALHKFLKSARIEASQHSIDLIEAIFDESTYKDCDKEKLMEFFRDAAKQIIIALNPTSKANHQELHIGCTVSDVDSQNT
ncbi:MAG: SDR family oxidoreductase [Planctomycetes bacterium]|nr:SDR family oxidoreductase [Planctomycetota bacterium]